MRDNAGALTRNTRCKRQSGVGASQYHKARSGGSSVIRLADQTIEISVQPPRCVAALWQILPSSCRRGHSAALTFDRQTKGTTRKSLKGLVGGRSMFTQILDPTERRRVDLEVRAANEGEMIRHNFVDHRAAGLSRADRGRLLSVLPRYRGAAEGVTGASRVNGEIASGE